MAPKKKAAKADKKEKAPKEKEHKEEKSHDSAPDPASVDFEAGLLFNKADSSRTGSDHSGRFPQIVARY